MKTWTLLPLLFITNCTLGPNFSVPKTDPGKTFKVHVSYRMTQVADEWWTLFDDSELNRLVSKAIAANNDLAAAHARRDTARALVGVDRARLFPSLDLSSSAGVSRISSDNSNPGIKLENQRYRSTFDLSYDLDLWGANRRRVEAATALSDRSDQLINSQRLGIATEVARQYFILRALDAQEKVLRDTITSRSETYSIEKSRTDAGLADTLASSRANTEIELANNDLASVIRQRGSTENALAVLCGTTPASFKISSNAQSARMPDISPGLPATVLARRPDVRAAELELRAANARIGITEAAFYPNISLTGSAGLESLKPSNFLDWQSRVLSIGSGLTAPLFDGGTNRANHDAAQSTYQETSARYRQTLLVALREVEDALVDLQGLARSSKALEAAKISALGTRNIAQERYSKGLSNYLEVVDADRSVLKIRLALAELGGQQRVSLAALIQALGGGWTGK